MRDGSIDEFREAATGADRGVPPPEQRRPYQFTLRGLFGVTTAGAVALSVGTTLGWPNELVIPVMILLTALIKIAVFLLVAAAIAFGLEYVATVLRPGTSRLAPTLRHEKPTQTDDPPPPNSTT